jgi:flavin reductase (DIM6/NTAB) family NADH-FMN oxidoreductase RutF
VTSASTGGAAQARRAARKMASAVTVLTVAHGEAAHGTTVSAVVTVSRNPLLVGACLHHGSFFTGLARDQGRFMVNVLSGRQGVIADWFADPLRPVGYAQFSPLDWTTDELTGAPVLEHCLASFACLLMGCYPIGDHDLILGEVVAGTAGMGSPLLALDGQLWAGDIGNAAARGRNRQTATSLD